MIFLGNNQVKAIPQDRVGEKGTQPKLMNKGWNLPWGLLCRVVTDKNRSHQSSGPHAWDLRIRTKLLGGQGTLSRYWELKMAPWELTGKVRREERDHGVRKLPVPGAGWAL